MVMGANIADQIYLLRNNQRYAIHGAIKDWSSHEQRKEKGIKTDNIDLSSPCYLSDTRCKGWILEPVCPTYSGGNLLRTEIYTNVIPIRV